MKIAEFEEKQYEIPLVHEIAASSARVYPVGQVLEELVGYDVALVPGDPRIWELLDTGMPAGALLTPGLWAPFARVPAAEDLPPRLVSLILQFKRPQYLDHWRAGQYDYWHGGYFRFYLDDDQQSRLQTLEGRVEPNALVRYAAAAFVEYRLLCDYAERRSVSENSTFVAPSQVAGHRLWSYASPGTIGYANPEGVALECDTIETLIGRARDQAEPMTLREHVRRLARGTTPRPECARASGSACSRATRNRAQKRARPPLIGLPLRPLRLLVVRRGSCLPSGDTETNPGEAHSNEGLHERAFDLMKPNEPTRTR